MNYKQSFGTIMMVTVLLMCASCSLSTSFEIGKSPNTSVGRKNASNPPVDNVRKPEWLKP